MPPEAALPLLRSAMLLELVVSRPFLTGSLLFLVLLFLLLLCSQPVRRPIAASSGTGGKVDL
jgi:hypothetical protein